MEPIKELSELREEDLKDDVINSVKEIQELVNTIPTTDENNSIIEHINSKFDDLLSKISSLSIARLGRFTIMEKNNENTDSKIDLISSKIDMIIRMMRHDNKGESKADEYYDKVYNTGDKYVGSLENNKRNGKGKMYYADNSIYDGEWKDDKKNGKGVYKKTNGDICEGDFVNDVMEGKGEYTYKNGRKYIGDFKNDKFEGKGKLKFPTGNEYNGEFKNGLFNGEAVFTYANGDRYVGLYKNGKKNGKGTYYYKSGEVYTGEWLKDERHGEGILNSKGKEQKLYYVRGRQVNDLQIKK